MKAKDRVCNGNSSPLEPARFVLLSSASQLNHHYRYHYYFSFPSVPNHHANNEWFCVYYEFIYLLCCHCVCVCCHESPEQMFQTSNPPPPKQWLSLGPNHQATNTLHKTELLYFYFFFSCVHCVLPCVCGNLGLYIAVRIWLDWFVNLLCLFRSCRRNGEGENGRERDFLVWSSILKGEGNRGKQNPPHSNLASL